MLNTSLKSETTTKQGSEENSDEMKKKAKALAQKSRRKQIKIDNSLEQQTQLMDYAVGDADNFWKGVVESEQQKKSKKFNKIKKLLNNNLMFSERHKVVIKKLKCDQNLEINYLKSYFDEQVEK